MMQDSSLFLETGTPMRPFMNMKRISVGTIILGIAVSLGGQGADAQEMRRRTLTYDLENKKWDEAPPPTPGTAKAELFEMKENIKKGEYKFALQAVQPFVTEFGKTHQLYPNILIAKAEALIGQEEYDKAYETTQEFLNEFSGIALSAEALRLEFLIAEAYLGGAKRKVWGMKLFSGEDLAMEILDELSTDYPNSRIAELAYKTKADHMFATGDHALAEIEYGRLLQEYPQSRYHQYALRRSADAALASFGGVEYDEAALIEADERYNDYRMTYPGDSEVEGVGLILDGIREKQAEKQYRIAQYYERTGHLSSAVYYYRLVEKEWADTLGASKASVRLEILNPVGIGRADSPVGSADSTTTTENSDR